MRPLPLCTGEQPLVPSSCGFIFRRTNLTTRNAIEVATRASLLTITNCAVSKVFLFCWHLSWGKEETRIGKVKEERKTPDRCYINPRKRNYSITLLSCLRDSRILLYYLWTRMSHPYPLTETDILVGDVLVGESLDITSSSRYPSYQQDRNPRHDKVERIEWMVLPPQRSNSFY